MSPILRDSYTAKAYSMDSLKVLLAKDHARTTKVIITTDIFVVVLSFFIILVILVFFFRTNSHTSSKWGAKVKKNWPAVGALTMLSFIANFYSICLVIAGVNFWQEHGKEEPARKLFHEFYQHRNAFPSGFVLFIDICCLIGWFVIVRTATKQLCNQNQNERDSSSCEHSKCHCTDCKTKECVDCKVSSTCRYNGILTFSATVICPVFCVIAHSPYIAIAYLNDGSHASSIFIYYAINCYALYGLSYLLFHWIENIDYEKESKKLYITISLLVVVIVAYLGLVAVISCYFVFIPINHSISDAPSRILSIYQSGGFVIGSIFVYKLLSHFHKNSEKDDDLEKIKKNVKKISDLLASSTTRKSKSAPTQETSSKKTSTEGNMSTTALSQEQEKEDRM